MFNIILFGPPGSGKGTQSQKLMQQYELKHLSTGDLLRSEIAAKTPLGMEAKSFMDNGILVPDEVVIGMISSALEANPKVAGFLFDGFPRTEAQAHALDKLLALHKTEISVVLALEVGEEELVQRLLNRGLTSGRADDINEFVIRERIIEYNKKTMTVADHYREQKKVVMIKGEGSVDSIFEDLSNAINERMQAAKK